MLKHDSGSILSRKKILLVTVAIYSYGQLKNMENEFTHMGAIPSYFLHVQRSEKERESLTNKGSKANKQEDGRNKPEARKRILPIG